MDLFSGWSSPLIYSKALPADTRNINAQSQHHHSTTSSSHNGNSSARNFTDNPLLFFSNQQKLGAGNLSLSISNQQLQQQREQIHPHISPSQAARSHSVQFSNQPHIIQQANETRPNFGDDHENNNNEMSSANAWAQNRCLLCLLYEEKLRVMQKRIQDLLSSGLTEGNLGTNNARKKIHSSTDVANVAHSTIVADPKKFLELLAQKDREIEEATKSAQHVAIDRDNLRSALDDAEMKLEIALRKLQQYENNTNGGAASMKSIRNANRLNQPSLLSTTAQDERSFSAASSNCGGDDANKNWTKLGPGEKVRRIHAQEQLGVDDDDVNEVSSNEVTVKNYSKNNTTGGNDPLITTSSLSEILSSRRREVAATSSSSSQSPFVVKSSASHNKNTKNSKGSQLTREIADEQLGMFPEHNLQDAPSCLSRLGPLPKPSSLRMGAIDLPSEDSWKLGGRKPGMIDMNAKGTPAKGAANNNNNMSSASAQDASYAALLRLHHYGNNNSNNNHDTEFSIHSPHYGSFGPQ